jgi:predicted alpha/beta-hydrolase family hydrolase
LSFPLHQPGRPEKSRAAELTGVTRPVLVVQGGADVFGGPEEVREAIGAAPHVQVVELPGATHALGPTARTSPEAIEQRERRLLWAVAAFIDDQMRQPPEPTARP